MSKYANCLSYKQLCELYGELKNKLIELSEDEEKNHLIIHLPNGGIKDLEPYTNLKYNFENCLFLKQKDEESGADALSVRDMSFNFTNIELNSESKEYNELEDVYIKFMLGAFGEKWKQEFISYKYQQELDHIGFYARGLKKSVVEFCENAGEELLNEQGQLCELVEKLHSNNFDDHFVSNEVKDAYLNKVTKRVERLENELESERGNN